MSVTVHIQLRRKSGEILTAPEDLGLKHLERDPRRGVTIEFAHEEHVIKARVARVSTSPGEERGSPAVTVLAEEL